MSLRIGVWGTDHPHAGGHLEALENLPEVARLLVFDRDPARAREVVEGSDKAEAVTSVEALLAPHSVDAIVCLLPTREAGPATLRALEAGIYVYGDKPGARTVEEMEQIAQAAQAGGAHFCPCYPWRSEPITREIKALIDRGILGDIWSFEARFITSQVSLRDPRSWLFHDEVSGGGILAWLGCHWIDLLAYLLGPAVQVSAMVATLCKEDIDVEDTAAVLLRLASGAVGVVRAGYSHKPFAGYEEQDLGLTFEGCTGSLYWPAREPVGYRLRTGHQEYAGLSRRWVRVEPDAPCCEGYSAGFLRRFLAAATQRTLPPATETDALYVLKVLRAAYRASATGAVSLT